MTKKYGSENQRSKTENILCAIPTSIDNKNEENSFDDDTSKLSFKEKMTLFNKKNSKGLTSSHSLKHNRNRLTQVKSTVLCYQKNVENILLIVLAGYC